MQTLPNCTESLLTLCRFLVATGFDSHELLHVLEKPYNWDDEARLADALAHDKVDFDTVADYRQIPYSTHGCECNVWAISHVDGEDFTIFTD